MTYFSHLNQNGCPWLDVRGRRTLGTPICMLMLTLHGIPDIQFLNVVYLLLQCMWRKIRSAAERQRRDRRLK